MSGRSPTGAPALLLHTLRRLMAYKQTVTEARYNKQVDDLVAAGGTIRDR